VVVLASTGNDQVLQVDPGFADQVGLLVIIEDGDFHPVVIRGLVYCKSKLVVPGTLDVSSDERPQDC